MRFVRFGDVGAEKPGVLDQEGRVRDLSKVVPDLAGDVLAVLPQVDPNSLPKVADDVRIGAPVGQVGKYICIGLNYTDHALELNLDIPEEPVVFMKATSAICGPFDPIVLPRGAEKGDWEVELAIVIGARAKYVSEAEAMAHVAGFTIANDVSERSLQLERGGQWTKGKSCDSFGPLGPWLVTPDEIDDVHNMALFLDVNGVRKQSGSTASMIFDAAQVVSYLSQIMTLNPGDVIATGTPPGVGTGRVPPEYLHPGDVVEAAISGLGQQRQRVMRDG